MISVVSTKIGVCLNWCWLLQDDSLSMTYFLFHLLAIGDETLKREGRKGEKHQWTIAKVIRGFYLMAYPSILSIRFCLLITERRWNHKKRGRGRGLSPTCVLIVVEEQSLKPNKLRYIHYSVAISLLVSILWNLLQLPIIIEWY